MTPENVTAVEASQPQHMSAVARVVGVLFEPTKTFEDIARKPGFVLPWILILLVSLGVTFAIGQHIGWERIVQHQLESGSRYEQMTPEQRAQGLTIGTKMAPLFGFGAPILGIPIVWLIISAVLLGIVAGIMSAPVKFKQVFAVVAHASVVRVISSILTIVVIFLKNPDQFNAQNPLAFNPGAFMDPQTTSKFVYTLASAFDLFTIWQIVLIAIGLKAAAGKKLSFGGALFSVVLPWAVLVLAGASLAGMFS